MSADLFDRGELERLNIPDAEVWSQRQIVLAQPYEVILKELMEKTPWRHETVVVWGKRHLQPRLIAWFGEAGASYTYSGISLAPLPWTPLLRSIKASVESVAGAEFNSVLLNYYRDNNDSMGFHSDDEPELGSQPIIASLSLGETRKFVFKHKIDKVAKPVRVELGSGHLLIMRGDTQRNWQHGIMKVSRRCGPRINLTFRLIA